MGIRACTKCGATKDISLFSTYLCNGVRGFRKQCKECSRAYFRSKARERYARNPERVKELSRESAKRYPEKVKERYKAWASTEHAKELKRKRNLRDYHADPKAAREKRSRLSYKSRADLSDSYIAFRLGGNIDSIPKELIELKRINLQIQRHLKEKGL